MFLRTFMLYGIKEAANYPINNLKQSIEKAAPVHCRRLHGGNCQHRI